MAIVFSRFSAFRGAALALLLAPGARAAQVILRPRVQSIEPSRREVVLRLRVQDGPQPGRWDCSVTGHPDARVVLQGPSAVVLHVPRGAEGLTLTVKVQPQGRPDLAARAEVVVLTDGEGLRPEARFEQIPSAAVAEPEPKGEPAPEPASPACHPGKDQEQGDFIRYGGTGGAVFAPAAAGGVVGGHWLVLDTESSTLHRVSPGGDDERLLGIPNAMALQDGGPDLALLSQARAIAPWPVRGIGAADLLWVIADTEAHALRWLDRDGNLTTLGGNGSPGCQNGPLSQATFNRPTGVVSDHRGLLYVAEEGSAVVRLILADGTVGLLAGVPGRRGWSDGEQGKALFSAPGGIALDEANQILYVTDGHGVRAICLATGAVRTVLGRVDQAGGSAADAPLCAVPTILAPMLRLPQGLAFHQGRLWIADSGNGRIRVFDPAAKTLATFPALPEVDGALACPGHLAFDPEGNCMVSAGSCLFQLTFPPAPAALPGPREDRPDAADPVGIFLSPAGPAPAPAVQEAKGRTRAGDPRFSPLPSSAWHWATGAPVPASVPQRPSSPSPEGIPEPELEHQAPQRRDPGGPWPPTREWLPGPLLAPSPLRPSSLLGPLESVRLFANRCPNSQRVLSKAAN